MKPAAVNPNAELIVTIKRHQISWRFARDLRCGCLLRSARFWTNFFFLVTLFCLIAKTICTEWFQFFSHLNTNRNCCWLNLNFEKKLTIKNRERKKKRKKSQVKEKTFERNNNQLLNATKGNWSIEIKRNWKQCQITVPWRRRPTVRDCNLCRD